MKSLLCICLAIAFIGCEKVSEKQITETQPIEEPLPPRFFPIDTSAHCSEEFERAKKDISKGIFVLQDYTGRRKFLAEVKELLAKKNILYVPAGMNCTGVPECYAYYMDSIIRLRFGEHLLDRLQKEAEGIARLRLATRVFDCEDYDTPPEFKSYQGEPDSYEYYIFKNLNLPEGWDRSPMENNERQYILLDVVIDADGKAILQEVTSYNLKERNQKYLGRLKKDIINLIEHMPAWEPATFEGHNVKSLLNIEYDL